MLAAARGRRERKLNLTQNKTKQDRTRPESEERLRAKATDPAECFNTTGHSSEHHDSWQRPVLLIALIETVVGWPEILCGEPLRSPKECVEVTSPVAWLAKNT